MSIASHGAPAMEVDMRHFHKLSALAVVALTAVALQASAQPSDVPADPMRPRVSRSDEHRIVGKVLQIDREAELMKLASDEGVLLVEVPRRVMGVFRVGDTVSVPRSAAESPSASPRR
jgi:hypothetical protein